MNRTLSTHLCSIAVLMALFAGSVPVAGQGDDQPTATPNPESLYRLGAGDVLDLRFPYHTDFNSTVTIRPDGRISLVMIGDVRAEGRTPLELAALINDRYEKVVRRPEVSVVVREF